MALQVERSLLARCLVALDVERDAVARRDARIAVGGQLGARPAKREIDVEENCPQAHEVAVRQTGVGHRYAFACRFASDGSFARMSSRCARSSSAEITVSSSAACASTRPHGSTISERPYAGLPGNVSPICAAATT